MKENIEAKIIAFFEGELNASEKQALLQQKEQSEQAQQLFQEYAGLYAQLQHQHLAKPEKNLKADFEQLLQQEKRGIGRIRNLYRYSIAASIIIFLGVAVWTTISNTSHVQEMNRELATLRQNMQNLLAEQSTSARIKAVNMSYELSLPDEDVLNALINTLQSDPSENVRSAAIDALSQFIQIEKVKQAFINTLAAQESEYLQIKIIQVLANIKAKEALPSFENILENAKASPLLKQETEQAKAHIIKI